MTLYNKWSPGKNIMFFSMIVMLVCLFISWFSVGGADAASVDNCMKYWDQYKDLSSYLGLGSGINLNEVHCAYVMSNLRWLAIIPMAYGGFYLFGPANKFHAKKWCCISALITIAYAILSIILGFHYFNAAAWIFLIAAIVFFIGATTDTPATAEANIVNASQSAPEQQTPKASDTKFCTQCGEKNNSGSEYCSKCGAKL